MRRKMCKFEDYISVRMILYLFGPHAYRWSKVDNNLRLAKKMV